MPHKHFLGTCAEWWPDCCWTAERLMLDSPIFQLPNTDGDYVTLRLVAIEAVPSGGCNHDLFCLCADGNRCRHLHIGIHSKARLHSA
jgi:hypothetical protein